MTKWTLDEKTLQGELRLVDDLTVEGVAHFKEAMLQAFDEAEQVTLNLENVTNIDVAGLQIICACHQFSVAHDKHLLLQTGDNPVFAKIVEDTGSAQWVTRNFDEK